jgi:RimJ/RimL family protein N-acetyltransferase
MTRRIPPLETGRLIVRELTMDDLEAVERVLGQTTGGTALYEARERWLRWTVLGYEMFALLEQPPYGDRAIALKSTGELVGSAGIVPYIYDFSRFPSLNRPPDVRATAEVGLYWAVAPAHQGQGYATEAARAIVDHLFSRLDLGRVIATTGVDNVASQAVMRKLGMTVEWTDRPGLPGIQVVGVLYNRPVEGTDVDPGNR